MKRTLFLISVIALGYASAFTSCDKESSYTGNKPVLNMTIYATDTTFAQNTLIGFSAKNMNPEYYYQQMYPTIRKTNLDGVVEFDLDRFENFLSYVDDKITFYANGDKELVFTVDMTNPAVNDTLKVKVDLRTLAVTY